MTHPPTGKKRALLSVGAVLAVGAAVTWAAVSSSVETATLFDGSRNTLDVRAQASFDPDWRPGSLTEMSADPISVHDEDLGTLLPGESRTIYVAVGNASPRNPALVTMHIDDPDDLTGVPGEDGERAELFADFLFTVEEDGAVLLDRVPGTTVADLHHTWARPLKAQATRFLTVTVTLDPARTDPNRPAHSGVSVRFDGVSVPR
ncbi:hypothetical protein [Leucobacter luti]|uniref:Ribosomally synthesized peptide with SipW-like signal peptide n=1 Tax=Leucobacter luti TaxID=340320 RepID=A0A4Q7TP73_9MICO|nr:hypothetical protein [Leucobacter luti]MBL3700185.1 hypothetical protein [Leucobacter luti]RZT61092.1 hypothetical protein EV139_2841 [Leucobacter luti]